MAPEASGALSGGLCSPWGCACCHHTPLLPQSVLWAWSLGLCNERACCHHTPLLPRCAPVHAGTGMGACLEEGGERCGRTRGLHPGWLLPSSRHLR